GIQLSRRPVLGDRGSNPSSITTRRPCLCANAQAASMPSSDTGPARSASAQAPLLLPSPLVGEGGSPPHLAAARRLRGRHTTCIRCWAPPQPPSLREGTFSHQGRRKKEGVLLPHTARRSMFTPSSLAKCR